MGNMTMLLQETIQGNRVVKAFGMEAYEKQRFDEENNRLFRLYMKGDAHPRLHQSDDGGPRRLRDRRRRLVRRLQRHRRRPHAGRVPRLPDGALPALRSVQGPGAEPTPPSSRPWARPSASWSCSTRRATSSTGRAPAGSPASATASASTDVSFRYDRRAGAARRRPGRFRRGEVVALVGMSGGGKSTLADLHPALLRRRAGRHHASTASTSATTPSPACARTSPSSRSTPSCSTTRCATTSPTATSQPTWTRSSPRRAPPTRTSSSWRCPRATTPSSASSG